MPASDAAKPTTATTNMVPMNGVMVSMPAPMSAKMPPPSAETSPAYVRYMYLASCLLVPMQVYQRLVSSNRFWLPGEPEPYAYMAAASFLCLQPPAQPKITLRRMARTAMGIVRPVLPILYLTPPKKPQTTTRNGTMQTIGSAAMLIMGLKARNTKPTPVSIA